MRPPRQRVFFKTVSLVAPLPSPVVQQFDAAMSLTDFKGLIRRIAPNQATFSDQIVSVQPYQTANSGSGAQFFLIDLKGDPNTYFFKCDAPGSAIVAGEANAYLAHANCGLDRLYLAPKALSVGPPAFIAME